MQFQLLFVAICLNEAIGKLMCGANIEPKQGRLQVSGFGNFIVQNFYQCLNLGMRIEMSKSVNYDTISRNCQLNMVALSNDNTMTPTPSSLYSPISRQQCQKGTDGLKRVCGSDVCDKVKFCVSVGSTQRTQCLSIVKSCGKPPPVNKTTVDYTSTSWMAKAKYDCSEGYKYVNGSQIIQCTNRGWTVPGIVCASDITSNSIRSVNDNDESGPGSIEQ
ncbi:hypothetical protein LOTGIDRAFT_157056 [Lottia gigantea]|uniref:Sushi domain-containing protein n=1 Tax=Lottia gigantea TaxID=225164 RepID=V4BAU8_LOTGI|nr:hypothetical protein LOTGIDRAFT_157056 [Lottia gigantea]ESP03092.1 hypothetical protein LOTGIDRAFT_157056 [Lottia gigantea]